MLKRAVAVAVGETVERDGMAYADLVAAATAPAQAAP